MAKSLDEKRNFNVFPKGPLTGIPVNSYTARITGLSRRDDDEVILKENRLLKIASASRKKGKKIDPNFILLYLQKPDGLDFSSPDEKRILWRKEIYYFMIDKSIFYRCFSFRGNIHQNFLFLAKNEEFAESETGLV